MKRLTRMFDIKSKLGKDVISTQIISILNSIFESKFLWLTVHYSCYLSRWKRLNYVALVPWDASSETIGVECVTQKYNANELNYF